MKNAAFLLFLALAFTGCTRLSNQGLDQVKLAADVAAGSMVRLGGYTSFEWDRVFIFGPYTPPAAITEAVGSDVWFPHRDSETHCLLVFRFHGKTVRAFEVDRNAADFEQLFQKTGYAREEADFDVDVRALDGWRFLKKNDALPIAKASASDGSP